MTECLLPYHKFHARPEARCDGPVYLVRCAHLGGRCVDELSSVTNPSWAMISYVQYDPEFKVFGCNSYESAAEREACWQDFNEWMLSEAQ